MDTVIAAAIGLIAGSLPLIASRKSRLLRRLKEQLHAQAALSRPGDRRRMQVLIDATLDAYENEHANGAARRWGVLCLAIGVGLLVASHAFDPRVDDSLDVGLTSDARVDLVFDATNVVGVMVLFASAFILWRGFGPRLLDEAAPTIAALKSQWNTAVEAALDRLELEEIMNSKRLRMALASRTKEDRSNVAPSAAKTRSTLLDN